jgi:hypothetical protein
MSNLCGKRLGQDPQPERRILSRNQNPIRDRAACARHARRDQTIFAEKDQHLAHGIRHPSTGDKASAAESGVGVWLIEDGPGPEAPRPAKIRVSSRPRTKKMRVPNQRADEVAALCLSHRASISTASSRFFLRRPRFPSIAGSANKLTRGASAPSPRQRRACAQDSPPEQEVPHPSSISFLTPRDRFAQFRHFFRQLSRTGERPPKLPAALRCACARRR